MFQNFFHDLRISFRMLSKSPLFSLVAVLTLTLGIAANTTIFSFAKGVMFRPLPAVKDPGGILILMGKAKGGQETTISYPDYLDYRDRTKVFSSLVACGTTVVTLSTSEGVERVWTDVVTGNYFSTLGVGAALGRVITPDDDRAPSASPVLVLSHSFWQRRFGSDPSVIGRQVRINGNPFTIVGVATPGFVGTIVGVPLDIFVPVMMQPQVMGASDLLDRRDASWLVVQARLAPGVSRQQAQAAVTSLAEELAVQFPVANEGKRALLLPREKTPFGAQRDMAPLLVLLLGLVGVVLLVACANVAGIFLARASARRKEIAVRAALGASRFRLVRQLLTEGFLLSIAAAVAGLLLTLWTSDFFARPPIPTEIPLSIDSRPDGLVLAFTAFVCILTTFLFALSPALTATRCDLATVLKDESASVAGRRSRFRDALVVAQVAFSLVLLVTAGLFLRSLDRADAVDPGFNYRNVLLGSLDIRNLPFDQASGAALQRRVVERIRTLPGVTAVALAREAPMRLTGMGATWGVDVEGYAPQKDEDLSLTHNIISPDYLPLMAIPLRAGRNFTDLDTASSARVAIVNESFARRFWPHQDPLGRRFRTASQWWTVVGLAADSRYVSMDESPRPHFYLPVAQDFNHVLTLFVRTAADPMLLAEPVRKELTAVNADLGLFDVRSLDDHVGVTFAMPYIASRSIGAFGTIALLLASIGLYGQIAYDVTRRTREVGIRIALGAGHRDILRLIVGQGLGLILIGMVLGLAGAYALSRAIVGLLFGVNPGDPATYLVVSFVLFCVGLFASYLPARRALRINPVTALHYE